MAGSLVLDGQFVCMCACAHTLYVLVAAEMVQLYEHPQGYAQPDFIKHAECIFFAAALSFCLQQKLNQSH